MFVIRWALREHSDADEGGGWLYARGYRRDADVVRSGHGISAVCQREHEVQVEQVMQDMHWGSGNERSRLHSAARAVSAPCSCIRNYRHDHQLTHNSSRHSQATLYYSDNETAYIGTSLSSGDFKTHACQWSFWVLV